MIKVLERCITCLVNSFCIFHDFLDQVYLCIELPTSIRRNFQQAPSVSSPFDHQSEIYLLLNPSEVGNIYISAFLIFPCTLLTYRSHLITEIYLYLIWMSHIIYNQISSFFFFTEGVTVLWEARYNTPSPLCFTCSMVTALVFHEGGDSLCLTELCFPPLQKLSG